MYRESLLGTALAITLEEIAPHLNEGQRERVWQVFDQTMEECLAEVPMMTRVTVTVPPPLSASLTKAARIEPASEVSTLVTAATGTTTTEEGNNSTSESLDPLASSLPQSPHPTNATSTSSSSAAALSLRELADVVDDPHMAFPVYRCVDGRWTILLKDPEVRVRDESGREDVVQLDYLKVYLQELAPQQVSHDAGGKSKNSSSKPGTSSARAGNTSSSGGRGGKRPRG